MLFYIVFFPLLAFLWCTVCNQGRVLLELPLFPDLHWCQGVRARWGHAGHSEIKLPIHLHCAVKTLLRELDQENSPCLVHSERMV